MRGRGKAGGGQSRQIVRRLKLSVSAGTLDGEAHKRRVCTVRYQS